jgi:hypothetical protein
MLHAIEIVPTARSFVRRATTLGCELTTDAQGTRREALVDLSPRGARVWCQGDVERGEQVILAFAPERLGRRIETLARVAHVQARSGSKRSMIGLEFLELDRETSRDLARGLRGVPPPLPRARTTARRAPTMQELVWLDMLVTWEEDLGDRVNVFEVAERMAALDDGELVIETLAPFLTGSGGRYQWIH